MTRTPNIESLANLLANNGFGEFDTYGKGMRLGDVKTAFDKAEAIIKAKKLDQATEQRELGTLKRFKDTLNLK